MYLFQKLDKWCYDIEQDFKCGIMTPRTRRQYVILCSLRDKYYSKYVKEIERKNKCNIGVHHCVVYKWCNERILNPPPTPRKIK